MKKRSRRPRAWSPFSSLGNYQSGQTNGIMVSKVIIRIINTGQHIQQTQGLVLIPKANGDTMWVHPDLVEGGMDYSHLQEEEINGEELELPCHLFGRKGI